MADEVADAVQGVKFLAEAAVVTARLTNRFDRIMMRDVVGREVLVAISFLVGRRREGGPLFFTYKDAPAKGYYNSYVQ